MINDLKIALAGWYLGICQGVNDTEIAWNQPELKNIMTKYSITPDDVIKSIPKEWDQNMEKTDISSIFFLSFMPQKRYHCIWLKINHKYYVKINNYDIEENKRKLIENNIHINYIYECNDDYCPYSYKYTTYETVDEFIDYIHTTNIKIQKRIQIRHIYNRMCSRT